jgi:UDP-N-acetylglucosamine 4,6-dehydratase
METLKDKTVMITGGTGSFGQSFVKKILEEKEVESIIVFSRDELKQFEMQANLDNQKVRFVLGDVRDYKRLLEVSTDVDVIIHAAAMKQITAAELNPIEAIKTNVLGAENIVRVAIENEISSVIALSTDKASNPANLYGATKLCSDKLIIAGNNLTRDKLPIFSVVRYGNILGSRGSVIPLFLQQAKTGTITITNERMTRFWLSLDDGVDFVLNSIKTMQGGEIFIPKIPSFRVIDAAKVVAPEAKINIIGIRPGEKLHEIMITEDDSNYTYEFDDHFAIVSPSLLSSGAYRDLGKKVPEGFNFSSDNNKIWHTDESFLKLLKDHGILN